jgi:preprotein translocase subunit SecA
MQSPDSAASRAAASKVGVALPTAQRAGRNDPCPCGSGKKYKRCHGLVS